MFSPLFRLTLLPLSLLGLAACGETVTPGDQNAPPNQVSTLTAGALLATACSGCHSDQAGAISSLNDYSENTLRESLNRYKTETDGSTVMHRLARGYSETDIAEVSAYLSKKGASE